MGAGSPPDHVRCAITLLGPVLPGSASVRRPSHLIDSGCALDALDAKPRPELTGISIRDELGDDDFPEPLPLRR